MDRIVVVLCGPPGAGKSTIARQSGLTVYDRDDPQWATEAAFRVALAEIGGDPAARAVVIRAGATSSARARATRLVRATHAYLVIAPRDALEQRVVERGRAGMLRELAGIDRWLREHDRRDGVCEFPGWGALADGGTCSGMSIFRPKLEW